MNNPRGGVYPRTHGGKKMKFYDIKKAVDLSNGSLEMDPKNPTDEFVLSESNKRGSIIIFGKDGDKCYIKLASSRADERRILKTVIVLSRENA